MIVAEACAGKLAEPRTSGIPSVEDPPAVRSLEYLLELIVRNQDNVHVLDQLPFEPDGGAVLAIVVPDRVFNRGTTAERKPRGFCSKYRSISIGWLVRQDLEDGITHSLERQPTLVHIMHGNAFLSLGLRKVRYDVY